MTESRRTVLVPLSRVSAVLWALLGVLAVLGAAAWVLVGAAGDAVVDFGAGVQNSLTPGQAEAGSSRMLEESLLAGGLLVAYALGCLAAAVLVWRTSRAGFVLALLLVVAPVVALGVEGSLGVLAVLLPLLLAQLGIALAGMFLSMSYPAPASPVAASPVQEDPANDQPSA